MGTNTLNNRSAGQTIQDTFFNDLHQALNGDFVGRGGTGVPTAGQNLGTVAIPWGAVRADTLILGGAAVDTSQIVSPQNRVISGKKRSTSNQPAYIIPAGSSNSLTIEGTPVNLVFDVNSAVVSVTADLVKSSLATAPSSQNTALINDTNAADQADTRLWGEVNHKKSITIDTVGTNITALVGKWAAFKLAGVSTEYFLAYINSATELTNCFRGYYYDSLIAPINRTAFSNNDVLTLMNIAWIFIENDGVSVDVTYNNPVWSFTSPPSPATGDYWYDLANELWQRYDGASFQIINRTFVGTAILDSTNCIAARSLDFYANYQSANDLELKIQTSEIVRANTIESRVNVAGRDIRFKNTLPTWNITTDLAASADMYNGTEQPSMMYYLYVTDEGETIISDITPYKRSDLYGYYHPHNPWRMIGSAFNDASSDIVGAIGINQKYALLVQNDVASSASTISGTDPVVLAARGFNSYDTTGFSYDITTGKTVALFPGIYDIAASIGVNLVGLQGYEADLTIMVNGNFVVTGVVKWDDNYTTTKAPYVNMTIPLMAGDEVYVVAQTNIASTLATTTSLNYFKLEKVGDL